MIINEAGGDFQLVEREIPQPAPNQVRIKVNACGICHSDAFVKEGTYPGISYPRIPGHEIVGTVDALGTDVKNWKKGQRVGVGWHGGHCFNCDACRDGDFIQCKTPRSAASATTAATPSTSSHRRKQSPVFPMT